MEEQLYACPSCDDKIQPAGTFFNTLKGGNYSMAICPKCGDYMYALMDDPEEIPPQDAQKLES